MPDMPAPTIVWFRLDLRVADNPALSAAARLGGPVLPLFILDDDDAGAWSAGGASRWWLHQSLASLRSDLAARGLPLILRRGRAEPIIDTLLSETSTRTVLWNRRYEPWARERDGRIKEALQARGVHAESFNASLLYEPWEITSKQGTPLKVFTPFWKALRAKGDPDQPLPVPDAMIPPTVNPPSNELESWNLTPSQPDWSGGLRQSWQPGEGGAARRLAAFVDYDAHAYNDNRNVPGITGTSGLSPHLHFGEISPRQIWHAATLASETRAGAPMDRGTEVFLSEIAWREFSHSLLFHNPSLPETSLKPTFEEFPWIDDPEALTRWQRGETGYPIVDAGMRQLWQTGWMHNRVRMIAASFLIKDLMVHWRHGQAWFWDTLVDADLASNAASWQWIAGCGADAAPYFRVFNPTLQGEKFDPDGAYVRRWVPELARLPDRLIHRPWEAGPLVLREAGVALGETYPTPMVDHAMARNRALAAYESIRKA